MHDEGGSAEGGVGVDWEPVRVRASSVAACCGVHPYAQVDEVWTELIYQGRRGAAALAWDAALLGAVVETKAEAADRVLRLASEATIQEVRKSMKDATDSTTTTVAKVDAVARKTEAALKRAVARKELTAEQAADVKSHVLSTARTEFGTRLEDRALDQYEQQTGNKVDHRNQELYVWRAPPRLEEASSESLSSASLSASSSSLSEPYVFSIVGKVDGIAYDVDYSDPDPERWRERRVVVEVKHRVSAALRQPETHDQIQVVIYALLSGTDAGDLVQCLRRRPGGGDDADETTSSREKYQVGQDDAMRIDRVLLADHEADFHKYILPRLYDLVEKVDEIRRDGARRRSWLAASPRGRWGTAADLCDWLPLPPDGYRGAFCFTNDATHPEAGGAAPPSPVVVPRRRRPRLGADADADADKASEAPTQGDDDPSMAARGFVDPADVDPSVLDELPPALAAEIRAQIEQASAPPPPKKCKQSSSEVSRVTYF